MIDYQEEEKKRSAWQEMAKKASSLVPLEKKALVWDLRKEMKAAADELDFERAIEIREAIKRVA